MATITLNKELLVVEDLEQGTGTITQNRGVGTKINASNLTYDGVTTIKTEIDLKESTTSLTAKLALKANLAGNVLQVFNIADATTSTEATSLGQVNTLLSTKADSSSVTASLLLKADKTNVLELNNAVAFTPTSQYQPATKKYVDDSIFNTGAADMRKAVYDVTDSGRVDTTEGVGIPLTFLGVSSQDQIMRLAQSTITDCNSIVDMGIFIGVDVSNAPANGTIGVEQLKITTGKAQRCYSLVTRDSYSRTYDNVSWSPWVKVLDQNDIINSLVGSLDPYAVLHAQQGKVLNDTKVSKDSDTGAAAMPYGTTAQRPGTPAVGYMRFNTDLGKAEVWNGSLWSSVGSGATGGGADTVFVETSFAVTTNYTLSAGKSAITVGDSSGNVTIANGVTVTIPDGSKWEIL